MKQKLISIILILVILAGLSLVLYPTVSDYVNSLGYRRTIEEYKQTVQALDPENCRQMLEEARAFNQSLGAKSPYPLSLSEEETARYLSLLNVSGNGIMGYVEVSKLGISLPIYHGTGEAVLQSGVGHLEGSALPVGGEGTHAVLAGHTGLPSTELFTHINQLQKGDVFLVRVLNETLAYEVDSITTLKATDPGLKEPLRAEEGMDYCTLQTCTPYGVNSHRLFVRGHRVPTPEEELSGGGGGGGFFFGPGREFNPLLLIPVALAAIFLVGILLLSAHYRKLGRRAAEAADRFEPETGTDETRNSQKVKKNLGENEKDSRRKGGRK